ncbi:MAG: GDSL-type esterase/lipase family protein [Deltaproteobacteria bacterium]|jgi:lysophospholipase L1-like esterase|nr:GDSL-type esterase/lipase family protein [Deltaproteobacteria bacterium]
MKKMNIACLGDSLTYGSGVRREETWVFLAGKELAPHVMLHNHGLSGDTTAGMLKRLHADVLPLRPDAVLLMGGFNDIAYEGSTTPARANIPIMARIVAEQGAVPLICIPPPYIPSPREEWGSPNNLIKAATEYNRYADWLRDLCASSNYRTVDFRACFEERGKLDKTPPDGYFLDGLHYNAKGHQVLAACLTATARRLWGADWK